MPAWLRSLRTRLILGALLFLLALTGAIILVVRDSLRFSARNMETLSQQGLLEHAQASLLEITRREAELSEQALQQSPEDLTPLHERLQKINLTPHTFAFVIDRAGLVKGVSPGATAPLWNSAAPSVGGSLSELGNPELQSVGQAMLAGSSAVTQLTLGDQAVLLAYAPLPETGWSLAIVTPVLELTALTGELSQNLEASANRILQATLLTIGYFAVLVIVGVVLTARALTGPIQTLVDGTRSIAAGDLSVRIPVKSSDELGILAESFNQMAKELAARNHELVQANAGLSEREARLRLITEISADALYEWDIQAGKTQWNHSYRTLFGYPAEGQHEHKWWRERVHPDDLEPAVARLELALQNRDEFISFEYRYCRADGTYAHVVDRGYFFYDASGQPLRMVGAMIDITDRVTLSEAQTRAALEERQRLARELHDSVTQSLYSLTLLAEASRRTAQAGDLAKVTGNLARLGETAQQALKEMRLLVYELRPLALEQAGLTEALQHRLDAVEKRAGVEARLQVELQTELPAGVENTLYRVAQESLNNALKHAGATRVNVSLRSDAQQVELEIVDNGKGFVLETLSDHGGLGLVSIRERIEALGGTRAIFSSPGEGTRVQVKVPIHG